MLLIIFGAGASYDSSATHIGCNPKLKPPLAKDLFDDRPLFTGILQNYGRCQPLVTYLRGASNVEELLERYQSQSYEGDEERVKQLAAIRFYIRDAIWQVEKKWNDTHQGVTNYKTLVDEIRIWRKKSDEEVCFVTFNYDQMLEEAVKDVGITCSKIGDYIANPHYKVIKPHGSVNWARLVLGPSSEKPLTAQTMIESSQANDTPRINDEIKIITQCDQYSFIQRTPPFNEDERFGLYPAIAIPVISKQTFECPQSHISELCQLLQRMTKIMVIGWRGTERHFLKLIQDNCSTERPPVLIVSGDTSDAKVVENNISGSISAGEFRLGGGGFSSAIKSGEIEEFLCSNLTPP